MRRVPAPSMKEILAAGKTPVEVVSMADVESAPAGVTITGHAKPAERERKRVILLDKTLLMNSSKPCAQTAYSTERKPDGNHLDS